MIKRAVGSFTLLFLLLSSGSMAEGQREFIIDVPGAAFTRVIRFYTLKTALEYDPLHRNPRFADLLRRVNLN